LVLADQECLDDSQLDLIRQYVHQGGGLVATEQSSLYTPWRLRRRDFGLKDLFAVVAPIQRTLGDETDLQIVPVRNPAGRGRAVYVAAVKPAIEKPPTVWMTSEYWKLPLNWEELIEAVRWAAGGKFSLEIQTPETLAVTAEFIEQPGQGRRVVHLLNYAAPQGSMASNISVDAELPEGRQVRQVKLITPDGGEGATAPNRVANGRVYFTVPHLRTYTLAIIQME